MRRLLTIALAALAAVAIVGAGAVAVVYVRADVDTAGEVEFTRPLRIPPLAASRLDDRGRRVFDLTARAGRTAG